MEQDNKLNTGTASADSSEGSLPAGAISTMGTRAPINPDDLHDLFEGSPSSNDDDPEDPFAQMRNDPNYAALIKDLEAIAEAARQLFATEEAEPSDKVWDKIVGELGKEKGA